MYRMIMPDELQKESERLLNEYEKKYPNFDISVSNYIENNCSAEMKEYQEKAMQYAKEMKELGILV